MIQIITGSIIIVLGMYVFYQYPLKRDVKSLAMAALFVVLASILKRFSLMVPLFNVPALKIGLEMLPLMLSGMMLSPSYGFMVGLAVDIIGLIVTPTEFPFLGFTLNAVLTACIPALVLQKTKVSSAKKLKRIIKVTSILLGIAIIAYIATLDTVTLSKEVITITWGHKAGIIAISISWLVILWVVLWYMEKKVQPSYIKLFYIWILAVVMTEMGITFLLTPYWLQVMYQIPFMLSLFVRVIKQCIMIPIDIVIGYQLLKILKIHK